MRRLIKNGLLSYILLWTFATPAWSAQQRAATPAGAQDAATAVPAAISIIDVIPKSERDLSLLREIRQELTADKSFQVVEAGLPDLSLKIDEWWTTESTAIQQLSSIQRVNDLLWQWRVYERQISTWNRLLTGSSKKWNSRDEALNMLSAEWQTTRAALETTAPATVNSRIAEVLDEADATRQMFQEKTAQLVTVQSQLATRLRRLNEIRGEIEVVRQESTVSLLVRDSPTLWTALITEQSLSALSPFRESTAKLFRNAAEFLRIYRARLLIHLALFVVLAMLFSRLRGWSLKAGEFTPTAGERLVLEHGLACAFLMALFCGPLVYSDASPQMIRLILIPAIVPIFMLLPAIFSPRLRIALCCLGATYVLDFWRFYLAPYWSYVRLMLLVETLLGIVALYLILRSRKSQPETSSKTEKTVRILVRLSVVLFVISIGANLLGNHALAEMLFSPLIRTLFLGVVVRTISVVLTTFALIALRTPTLQVFRTVQKRGDAVAATIRKLANRAAVILWIAIGLFNIGASGYVVNTLESVLEARWTLGAVDISVWSVVTFIVVFWCSYALSRMLRFILAEEILPRFQLPRGVPDALQLLARSGVLVFGFLFALTSAGANLSQMTLALSALGVGIGFGLQNVVNNFVSGLVLVFEHPIQVGDYVEVGPHFGQVLRIGFRSSSLNTLDGGNVIIPNSELIGTRVMNWSLANQLRRISLSVPVPIGTDTGVALDILQKVARSQAGVVSYPSPTAAMEKFGDSSLSLLLRCWTRTDTAESVRFALTQSVNNAFKQAGIQIPFAQTDVHVHLPERAGIEAPKAGKSGEAPPRIA